VSEVYSGRQFVGMDLHRRRSVLVRMTESGEHLETVRIVNTDDRLADVMSRAGECPEVVLEATYGWYWAADRLAELGASVHLAHPLGVKAFLYRRVKNDERDAADLADLLRMGQLAHAWIAPPATRELRELVRHRAKLVAIRSSCKAEVHAVLAKRGVWVPMTDLFGVEGTLLLDRVELPGTRREWPHCAGSSSRWISRSTCSPNWPAAGWQKTPATSPSSRSPASARCWLRCSSPRSVTCTDSPGPASWRPGPDSHPDTTNPTPPCTAAASPNKARAWCGGRRSSR
jgi:hypothetical protein